IDVAAHERSQPQAGAGSGSNAIGERVGKVGSEGQASVEAGHYVGRLREACLIHAVNDKGNREYSPSRSDDSLIVDSISHPKSWLYVISIAIPEASAVWASEQEAAENVEIGGRNLWDRMGGVGSTRRSLDRVRAYRIKPAHVSIEALGSPAFVL